MSEPFLGMIAIFGFNFAPRGWAFCNGQLMSIAQNTALFSLLGTTYGGDGQVTFALPNLQSRVPLHFGQGPGLSNYALGEVTGAESVTQTVNQMPAHTHVGPAHTHQVTALTDPGSAGDPTNNLLAGPPRGTNIYEPLTTNTTTMAPSMIQSGGNQPTTVAGGSQPFGIIPPILALNFCIALEGIFPSRS